MVTLKEFKKGFYWGAFVSLAVTLYLPILLAVFASVLVEKWQDVALTDDEPHPLRWYTAPGRWLLLRSESLSNS